MPMNGFNAREIYRTNVLEVVSLFYDFITTKLDDKFKYNERRLDNVTTLPFQLTINFDLTYFHSE